MSSYNSVIPIPEALTHSPQLHPLKRKFEPVLLDRYPRQHTPEDATRQIAFPEYVPMFAFPSDINVIAADVRPRSTWHGFSMTAADNSRLYGVCIIVWIAMSQRAANQLEKRCEEWRRDNMTDAERDLAASLVERLAMERAKLSRLLADLPGASSGTDEREILEEAISSVEERINVISDMLKPLRHGAAAKIEGLTDGETGLWVPRAYGIIGRDGSMTALWKEWLRGITVPMADGAVLRIPASSPKVGMWQPLESYVTSLCVDAPIPVSSTTQVELTIRELQLFAKKEAINELPGSRSTDLYPLFRALTVPNIIILFEYVLSESRIILLSSHTSMLQLVSKALVELIWPLQWTGVYIPILPARLIQALEAPCPYICGVERRYEKLELPDDDFVVVDLDNNEMHSTEAPAPLPKQQRRKLGSLLYQAASHHNCGVSTGAPPYAIESFPFDAFSSENSSLFSAAARSTNLARLVALNSTAFGAQAAPDAQLQNLVFNAFLQAGSRPRKSTDRRRSASTAPVSSPDSPTLSPLSITSPPLPDNRLSRNDWGHTLQASLKDKRSGYFDSASQKSGSLSRHVKRKPSIPLVSHRSTSSIGTEAQLATSTYAPSTYAQSTLAASTIMPGMPTPHARNTKRTTWVEGHCLELRMSDGRVTCAICDEKAEDGHYRCSGCNMTAHGRCVPQITLVCPAVFFPDQIRAAFARCFASLFYTYRKFMNPANSEQQKKGMKYTFSTSDFIRSLTQDHAAYINMLQQTQAFNEFISAREMSNPPAPVASTIALFDAIILAKRNRGRLRSGMSNLNLGRNMFSSRSSVDILSDTSEHVWRTTAAQRSNEKADFGTAAKGRDYHSIVTRIPAKLEDGFLLRQAKPQRKQVSNGTNPSAALRRTMNGLRMNAP
jgi:DENN (AEX-3) domain/uDENN domain/dDENN domain/C1 domain